MNEAPLVIGLGPGFQAGDDVHRVIETNRGHHFGRVLSQAAVEKNTGVPGNKAGYSNERVLRAPVNGVFKNLRQLGDQVTKGDTVAHVDDRPVVVQIGGILRGSIRNDAEVSAGLKVGDIDPRGEASYCDTISDKARGLGGSVLEAILHKFNL